MEVAKESYPMMLERDRARPQLLEGAANRFGPAKTAPLGETSEGYEPQSGYRGASGNLCRSRG